MTVPNNLLLEKVTLDDIPTLTELWYAAFTTPGVLHLWPDTSGVRKWWDDANRGDMLSKTFQHYIKVVDPKSKDGQGRPRIAAYAKWDLAMPQERGPRYPAWSKDMPTEDCDAFLEKLENQRQQVMADYKKHYCETCWEYVG